MKAKKLLSLLVAGVMTVSSMASLAITANAVSAITDFTYSLQFSTVPTANDTAEIKDSSDNTVMTVTYLGGTWKANGGGIAPSEKADRPSGNKYTSGCAIQFVPASNGEVLVDRKLGSGKTLKIDENGENKYNLTNNESGSVSTKNDVATYTVDVEAGKTYIAYATGTGDEFYGIYYEPASSSTHTLSGAVNYTGTADTTGWKLVFTNAKDNEVQKVDFGETYSIDATQNRTYDITLEDAEGNAPEGTTIMLDTNSAYVGKQDVTYNIKVADVAEGQVSGTVKVHDINNDNTSLDLTGVTLTFTDKNDSNTTYKSSALTDNTYTVTLMSGKEYNVTATGATGYDLSPLSGEYTYVAGDPSPFKNILFTETLGTVDFASTVHVGASKEYATINNAITAIKKMTRAAGEAGRVTIEIDPGTYTEQVIVDTPYVTLKAADEANKPTIQWYYGVGYLYYSVKPTTYQATVGGESVTLYRGYYSEDYAVAKTQKTAVDRWGTACRITGTNVYVQDLIFKNTLNCAVTDAEKADGVEPAKNNEYPDTNNKPDRTTDGFDPFSRTATERAAAIAFDGDNFEAYNCEFISSQDTFYTGKNGYVKNCYIEGGTDYIFGGNSVVFDGCTLAWHGYSDTAADGHLTANQNGAAPVAGTPNLSANGYLIKDCTITNSKYFTDNKFAAGDWGRNWGAAKCQVVYDGITLSGVDVPKGWTSMGDKAPLSGSILYVNNVTDKTGAAVDVSGTTHNPNGTMATNNYTIMAATDYFGDSWIPPHYEASTDPDPSATGTPQPTATATADPSATATTDPSATTNPEATTDPSATTNPEATITPVDPLVPIAVTALPKGEENRITFSVDEDEAEEGEIKTTEKNGQITKSWEISKNKKIGDYVAVYANAENIITIDGSNKKFADNTRNYTARLKLGGSVTNDTTEAAAPTIRTISVTPAVAGTLTVDFAHASSSGDERTFAIYQNGKEIGTKQVAASASDTISVPVEANIPVYLYSKTSGINIYGIFLTETAQGGGDEPVDDGTISCTKIVATYESGALTNVVITPGKYTAEEIRNAAASNTATQKTFYWKSLSGETVDIEPITPPTPAPTPEPEPEWGWVAANDDTVVAEVAAVKADASAARTVVKGYELISGLTTLFDNASTNKAYIAGSGNGEWSEQDNATSSMLKYVATKDGVLYIKLNKLDKPAAIFESGMSTKQIEADPSYINPTESKTNVVIKREVEAGKTYYVTVKGSKGQYSAAAFVEKAVAKTWTASESTMSLAAGSELLPGLTTLFDSTSTNKAYITSGDDGSIKDGVVTGTALKYEAGANGTLSVTINSLGATKTAVIYDAAAETNADEKTPDVQSDVTLTAQVEAGKTYYILGKGTKARFSAASFTPASN